VTQNPDDIPEDILGQLGNRFQHALRAFTARDQKALMRAAETYRPNDRFDTAEAIRDVGVGEAVTSMLAKKGVPGIVERTLIRPPSSQLGPVSAADRKAAMQASPVAGKYDQAVDKRSAYEMLIGKANAASEEAEIVEEKAEELSPAEREFNAARRFSGARVSRSSSRGSQSFGQEFGSAMTSAVIKELKGTTGRKIVRGILGGLFKGR
ncbi:MAG: helicase HerA-like domain-containing protein, partial [Pseudomonadota bacterium]